MNRRLFRAGVDSLTTYRRSLGSWARRRLLFLEPNLAVRRPMVTAATMAAAFKTSPGTARKWAPLSQPFSGAVPQPPTASPSTRPQASEHHSARRFSAFLACECRLATEPATRGAWPWYRVKISTAAELLGFSATRSGSHVDTAMIGRSTQQLAAILIGSAA